jgi:hypothetical protein
MRERERERERERDPKLGEMKTELRDERESRLREREEESVQTLTSRIYT